MTDPPRSPTKDLTVCSQYFAEHDEEPPSPPPSRPRSSSLPVSGYRGALARVARRNEEEAVVQAIASPPVETASSSRVPFQELPFDVLSAILKAWMDDERADSLGASPRTPFYALRVCKSVRAAARGTASLWVYPEFHFRRMLGDEAWIKHHAWFADHARELPFAVRLYQDILSVPPNDKAWVYFRDNILVRARDIDLTISDPEADPDFLRPLRTYSFLETMRARFTGTGARCPVLRMEIHAPGLRLLELDRVHGQSTGGPNSSIEMVTTLEITQAVSSVEGLCACAQTFGRLRECALRLNSLHDNQYDQFVWHGLETLHLTLDNIHGADNIPFRMHLPNLTTLGVRDYAWHWQFWRFFIEVSCPALTQLVVHRNHMDYTNEFLSALGDLTQIRTLVLRDGSLNNDIVTGLVRPLGSLPLPFPGLTAVHFENTVDRAGFEWSKIASTLLLRSSYLLGRRERGPFVLTCTLKPRRDPPGHDAYRMEVEALVRRYNDEERARVANIWKYMFPAHA